MAHKTAKYLIGYHNPDTNKDEEVYIQTDRIDFSVYNPEHIYYISKFDGKVKADIKMASLVSLYMCIDYNTPMSAQNLIQNYESLPEIYKPLSLYDKMLIWMFNNPDRAKYELSNLSPEAQAVFESEEYIAKAKYWDFNYDEDICQRVTQP